MNVNMYRLIITILLKEFFKFINEMFGFSMTPIKQKLRVIPNPDGPGYIYEVMGG